MWFESPVIPLRSGDCAILCGLMGARKTAFAVQHFLMSKDYATVSNIPLADGVDLPNHRILEDGAVLETLSSLENCMLVWDEAGAACATMPKPHIDRLARWLATIRHRQVSVIFICQAPEQLDKRIHLLAHWTINLVNVSSRTGFGKFSAVKWYTAGRYTFELRKREAYGVCKDVGWKPPNAVYECFRSVDLGTADIKRRIPMKMKVLLGGGACLISFWTWAAFSGAMTDFFFRGEEVAARYRKKPSAVLSADVGESPPSLAGYICRWTGRSWKCLFELEE